MMPELVPRLPFPEEPLLLDELNHRIVNEFASLIAIVSACGPQAARIALLATLLTGAPIFMHALRIELLIEFDGGELESPGAATVPPRSAAAIGPWREPTLKDILSEPIVKALMRADGVDYERLRAMLRRISAALRTRCAAAADARGSIARIRDVA